MQVGTGINKPNFDVFWLSKVNGRHAYKPKPSKTVVADHIISCYSCETDSIPALTCRFSRPFFLKMKLAPIKALELQANVSPI